MKKLLAGITAISLFLTSPGIAKAQEFTEFEHENDTYYSQTLKSKGVAFYKYKIPAMSIGVFTLKNHSRKSDFDIYIYDSGSWKPLGTESGVKTELVTTSMNLENRYAYIKIVNYGSQSSRYHFYANHVNLAKNVAFTAAETLFACGLEGQKIDPNIASRGVTAVSSILQGNNLKGLTMDMAINEITNRMREELGYGCTGDFVVSLAISTIKDIFRNYP
jgi:hypothetical protein